jgi:hypothetical protein
METKNMKLTKKQLRRIIKEELENVTEAEVYGNPFTGEGPQPPVGIELPSVQEALDSIAEKMLSVVVSFAVSEGDVFEYVKNKMKSLSSENPMDRGMSDEEIQQHVDLQQSMQNNY